MKYEDTIRFEDMVLDCEFDGDIEDEALVNASLVEVRHAGVDITEAVRLLRVGYHGIELVDWLCKQAEERYPALAEATMAEKQYEQERERVA